MDVKRRTKIPSESLSPEETAALVEAASGPTSDPRLAVIVLLGLNHGLRISELCKLRPEQIQGNAKAGYKLVIYRGKGSASGCHELTDQEVELLQPYMDYPSPRGTLFGLRRIRLYSLFRELCESIGLPQSKQSPHCLRHTCIKRALTAGAKLPEVQKFVGHKSLASTGHYTKVSESEASKACLPKVEPKVELA